MNKYIFDTSGNRSGIAPNHFQHLLKLACDTKFAGRIYQMRLLTQKKQIILIKKSPSTSLLPYLSLAPLLHGGKNGALADVRLDCNWDNYVILGDEHGMIY